MSDTINASINAYRPENYEKELSDINIHKYRNICPRCGTKGEQLSSRTLQNPETGNALHVKRYECKAELGGCGEEYIA